MDSPDRASDPLPALEGAPQDAPREACAPPEDEIPDEGSPGVEEVVVEAPLKVAAAHSFLTRLANAGPRKPNMHN